MNAFYSSVRILIASLALIARSYWGLLALLLGARKLLGAPGLATRSDRTLARQFFGKGQNSFESSRRIQWLVSWLPKVPRSS